MCGGNKKVIDYFLKYVKNFLPGVLDICLAEKLTLIT